MKRFAVPAFLLAAAACTTRIPTPNSNFAPPADAEIASGFALRERYAIPRPTGGTAIYVDSVAVHHLYGEASTIAWKDEAGKWQWSQASEIGPGGLLRIERKLESNKARTLTEAEARSLERLIREPELYDGRVRRTGDAGIGGAFHVMAIVTPFGRTTVRWDGRLRGAAGKVADIVLGRRD